MFDTPRPAGFRRFRLTSHLVSDLSGLGEARVELDAFARSIGLRLEWRQSSGTPTEHFDLFDGAIERAREAGAVEVTSRELVERAVRPKRAALLPSPGVTP